MKIKLFAVIVYCICCGNGKQKLYKRTKNTWLQVVLFYCHQIMLISAIVGCAV